MLGGNEIDNIPNWEAVDFEEKDFSHIENNNNEPTFFSQPIYDD
jgi:hypothetical protein